MNKTIPIILLIFIVIIFGIYFNSSNFSFKEIEINESTINDFGDENILAFIPEVCDRFYYEKDKFDWERNISNIEIVEIGTVVIEKGDFNETEILKELIENGYSIESCRGVYYYKNEFRNDKYVIVGNNLIIKANDISGIRWEIFTIKNNASLFSNKSLRDKVYKILNENVKSYYEFNNEGFFRIGGFAVVDYINNENISFKGQCKKYLSKNEVVITEFWIFKNKEAFKEFYNKMLKEYGNKSYIDENPKLKYYNTSRIVNFSVENYDNDVVLVREKDIFKVG
jgi:hypothetical protein